MPELKLIGGRPAACRLCKFVMDPRFPLSVSDVHPERYKVTCCRVAPPMEFVWRQTAYEPFCGQFEQDVDARKVDPKPPGGRARREGVFAELAREAEKDAKLGQALRSLFPHVEPSYGGVPLMPPAPDLERK